MDAGYLTAILERRRRELDERPPCADGPFAHRPPTSLKIALAGSSLSVIAEIKRRSPSKGALAPDLDVATMVARYADGGAAACSVLTDSGFAGTLDDLATARATTELPLLRKDFLVAPAQCAEARSYGADAVLLIVAALAGGALSEMLAAATSAGVEALVEVHDIDELDRALEAGAEIIGVNNRNLHTFAVDIGTSLDLADRFPAGVMKVSESGISDPAETAKLRAAGYDAVLVGEALVRAPDPAALIKAMGVRGVAAKPGPAPASEGGRGHGEPAPFSIGGPGRPPAAHDPPNPPSAELRTPELPE